jgi:hypothetical protein
MLGRMPAGLVPAPVRASADAYLRLADAAAPGLIEGLYLHGSVSFGDFQPERSDIDFVAVLAERPDARTVELLGGVLAELSGQYPRPYFDGLHVTYADLARPPGDCPDVPCVGEWQFAEAGRHNLNPVTWHELAWHAVTLRGPGPGEAEIWADASALRSYTHANLTTYWRPLLERLQAGQDAAIAAPASQSEWLTEWFVLGTARLHHLLATGTLTSKGGAGRYALADLDTAWHPIVTEALRIRTSGSAGSSPYRDDDAARIRDTIAFSAAVIEAGLALGA